MFEDCGNLEENCVLLCFCFCFNESGKVAIKVISKEGLKCILKEQFWTVVSLEDGSMSHCQSGLF